MIKLKCLSLLLMPLLFVACSSTEQEPTKRPNILFAFADDWGKHASAYAKVDGPGTVNDIISTPNFDAVAKRGVLFNNAFVNSPSCTPCRSSLLAGQHFWRTGKAAILQGATWDMKIPSYPLLLKDNGYHIGKSHKVWSPGSNPDAPYGGQTYDFSKRGRKVNQFSQFVEKQRLNGTSVAAAKKILMDEVRENFKDFIKAKKKDEPFCYWYGPTNVHRKWIKGSGKGHWNLEPNDLKGKMPPFLPDVHSIREDLADYIGEAQAFDMALGVLMEELKKAGEFENTIIVVSGDHGAPGFPYGKCNLYDFGSNVPLAIAGPGVNGGRVVEDLVSLPDLAPTFLEAGSVKAPEVMTGKSIWPTLKSNKEGLADSTRTEVYIGRERHVAVARKGGLPYPQRAIRTAEHLFIINFKPDRWPLGDPYLLGTDKEPTVDKLTNSTFVTLADEDAGPTKAWMVKNRKEYKKDFDHAYGKRPMYELYDLKKDPHQMNNVAQSKVYKTVFEKLKKQLMNELESTGDPRLVDNGKFFETSPMTDIKLSKKKKK
ncbi:MAG: sulfatase [Lentisphaeraceae bacterium]|nr:sulfatase [Lentisphaeraceae bacterium]